ncbi:MAG: hypothetical protein ACI8W8_004689, partial [Rhodothermales bacterium]
GLHCGLHCGLQQNIFFCGGVPVIIEASLFA